MARSIVLGSALGVSVGIPFGLLQDKARAVGGAGRAGGAERNGWGQRGMHERRVGMCFSGLHCQTVPASVATLPQVHGMLPEERQQQRQRRLQQTEEVIAGTGAPQGLWSGKEG